jgi:hypothetical protein
MSSDQTFYSREVNLYYGDISSLPTKVSRYSGSYSKNHVVSGEARMRRAVFYTYIQVTFRKYFLLGQSHNFNLPLLLWPICRIVQGVKPEMCVMGFRITKIEGPAGITRIERTKVLLLENNKFSAFL